MKIAVIGAGIAGLGAAYLLHSRHEIVVYESAGRLGGHSRTIDVPVNARAGGRAAPHVPRIPVDTGFIVFNDRNYPNLLRLFKHLNVAYEKSDMSFGASIDNGWLEYSSNGLFAQKINLLRPPFWKMLFDVAAFKNKALQVLESEENMTLRECLVRLRMGEWFCRYYLLAMGAAIWSCPVEKMMDFPARVFLRFFKNHGLLNIGKRPQWYTVSGGSRTFIQALAARFRERIQLNCGAARIARAGGRVQVRDTRGDARLYDHAVVACHADQALALLDAPTIEEREVLGAFRYQANRIVVHHDAGFMPRNRKCWASWIYLSQGRRDDKPVASLSYWMNNLQNLRCDAPVIATLNPGRRPRPELIVDAHDFTHPVFDRAAVDAQERMARIQNVAGLSFCGAYQRYGFHEDGVWSALRVAKNLGATPPWV